MSTVTALPEQAPFRWPPRGRPFTAADLDEMPDDGRRYEVVDGVLLVTPAPALRHQDAVIALVRLLVDTKTPGMHVVIAPYDVLLGPATKLQPDVLVARDADLTQRNLPTAPVLAVEVLSPSTRRIDLAFKRGVYEDAGVAAYWVVDPGVPSLRAWEWRDGAFVEVAHVTGEETFEATVPYPVAVTPASLVVAP